eukprot:m.30149 g.30149  ORF g.30149 m.30149 type:complete len:89 (-) comp12006_c0_seq3:3084-3350(-)
MVYVRGRKERQRRQAENRSAVAFENPSFTANPLYGKSLSPDEQTLYAEPPADFPGQGNTYDEVDRMGFGAGDNCNITDHCNGSWGLPA